MSIPELAVRRGDMSATYTYDVFSTLDGFASPKPGSWGGYWGKQGPELLAHRAALYTADSRLVFGASSYRLFNLFAGSDAGGPEAQDEWVTRMLGLPLTVISNSLDGPLDGIEATIASGDAVDVVAALKEESDTPIRSHASLSLNRALMAAGLVDRLQVTLFPVITGQNGANRVFEDAADFDLELIESRTFDGNIQELTYAPTRHV